MPNDKGWISIHRKIQENKIWFSDPFSRAQAWIDLILIANYEDGGFFIRGNWVEVKRGQVGYSKESLAKRWKWSRGKVIRFVNFLSEMGNIVQQNNPILSLITIKNYDEYQKNEQQTVQQTDNRRYTNNKKNKNNNNTVTNVTGDEVPKENAGVQKIFDIFYTVNPTINFADKTQRAAAVFLIQRLGEEKAIKSAEAAVAVFGQTYAPTITTPYLLKTKLAELVAYYQKQEKKSQFSSI